MNASAAATLQVGSTLVDPYSAVAAGCAALYGPLHGGEWPEKTALLCMLTLLLCSGANEAVVRMLMAIGKASLPLHPVATPDSRDSLACFALT